MPAHSPAPEPPAPKNPALPYVWMLLGAAAFAVMSILTARLKDRVDWQWIAIARAGLAMVFAATLAKAGGAKLVLLRPRKLWMRSLAGSISLVCGFYAMTHYPVSEVLTLTNMFPIWVALLSLPLLGEWPPFDIWPALAMGVIGVVLIQSPQIPGGHLAVAAALVSSFTSAVALIGLHQVRELDARSVVAHFSGVALACCVGALFVFPRRHSGLDLTLNTGLTLLGIGVCATCGQLLLTKAFAAGKPSRVSVVGLSQVGFTMLLEIAIDGRPFSPWTLLGIGLVVAPTAWTLLRGAARSRVVEAEPPLPLKKAA
ncbi:MAG TPA: DMT family transporter [Pirellulaceae bacterium]|nr:DMT family transporter [Pirellulaceae bacterium]